MAKLGNIRITVECEDTRDSILIPYKYEDAINMLKRIVGVNTEEIIIKQSNKAQMTNREAVLALKSIFSILSFIKEKHELTEPEIDAVVHDLSQIDKIIDLINQE